VAGGELGQQAVHHRREVPAAGRRDRPLALVGRAAVEHRLHLLELGRAAEPLGGGPQVLHQLLERLADGWVLSSLEMIRASRPYRAARHLFSCTTQRLGVGSV
jgi:hypothetical protein